MQPDDRGLLNGIPVLQVRRRGKDAVHFIAESVEVGSSVTGVIDWDRRWDHMQQHSGQHLITAIAEILFGFKTTSWWLGENLSHIELGKFFFPLNTFSHTQSIDFVLIFHQFWLQTQIT